MLYFFTFKLALLLQLKLLLAVLIELLLCLFVHLDYRRGPVNQPVLHVGDHLAKLILVGLLGAQLLFLLLESLFESGFVNCV